MDFFNTHACIDSHGTDWDRAVSIFEGPTVPWCMKLMASAVFGLLSAACAFSQQIGVVHIPLSESTQPTAEQNAAQLPPGCTQQTGGFGDGAVFPPHHQKRTISLEIVKLTNQPLEVGSLDRAEVRLKNVGDHTISIPWSTDSSVIQKAPSPDLLQWEQASLGIVLLDNKNRTIALKTAMWPLFGSKFDSGSQLTLKPGEWIAAFLQFKVEDLYHIVTVPEFPLGKARLFLEWRQASRTWRRETCGWNRVWLDYGRGGYYRQEHPTISVLIKRSGSGEARNAK